MYNDFGKWYLRGKYGTPESVVKSTGDKIDTLGRIGHESS